MGKYGDVVVVVSNGQNFQSVASLRDLRSHEKSHMIAGIRQRDGDVLFAIASETWEETFRSPRGMVFRADKSAHVVSLVVNCSSFLASPRSSSVVDPQYTFSASTLSLASFSTARTR